MTLSEYREKNGLTFRQLAKQVGVCPATIYQICKGKHPNLATIEKILKTTPLTIEDLLNK